MSRDPISLLGILRKVQAFEDARIGPPGVAPPTVISGELNREGGRIAEVLPKAPEGDARGLLRRSSRLFGKPAGAKGKKTEVSKKGKKEGVEEKEGLRKKKGDEGKEKSSAQMPSAKRPEPVIPELRLPWFLAAGAEAFSPGPAPTRISESFSEKKEGVPKAVRPEGTRICSERFFSGGNALVAGAAILKRPPYPEGSAGEPGVVPRENPFPPPGLSPVLPGYLLPTTPVSPQLAGEFFPWRDIGKREEAPIAHFATGTFHWIGSLLREGSGFRLTPQAEIYLRPVFGTAPSVNVGISLSPVEEGHSLPVWVPVLPPQWVASLRDPGGNNPAIAAGKGMHASLGRVHRKEESPSGEMSGGSGSSSGSQGRDESSAQNEDLDGAFQLF